MRTPWDPSASDRSQSSSSSSSFTPESFDIADMNFDSRMSSLYHESPHTSFESDTLPLLPPETVVLLTPRITITPEVPSIDAGHCMLWVAVEVSGILRNAEKNQIIELRSSGPTEAQISSGCPMFRRRLTASSA